MSLLCMCLTTVYINRPDDTSHTAITTELFYQFASDVSHLCVHINTQVVYAVGFE